ncbi:Dickkopf N-terminal cysteine-rich domain-containing protein [Corallococcus sp. EGB]|uniref:Dickkopf N-terminal cysteine-rich domain-containing protein n=1 Tax=Corallococcus sp. EGB TaxID=1521117 RepID=UPI001CC080DD
MRCLFAFLLVTLLAAPGCPLDIQVREEADAGCDESSCQQTCDADRECPAGQRCHSLYEVCEDGPRLTEPCSSSSDCASNARCMGGHCVRSCERGCPLGYQCGPESTCVETCEGRTGGHLSEYCETSMDCTPCGFCTDSGGGRKCHQPCRSDAECPGGGAGSCVPISGTGLRVCRP